MRVGTKRLLWAFFSFVAGAVLLSACATAPDWITVPPPDTPDSIYFVGLGSDPAGDTGRAGELAVRSMVAEVTRYIGVRITSDTKVAIRATLEAYEAEVIELISERSSAHVSDFRVVKRYVETTRDGSVHVYLLGAYEARALGVEKERFARLSRERFEAFAGPEREGDDMRGQGKLYMAAVRYLEAAVAALDSDVDYAALAFERVLKKAADTVSLMSTRKEGRPDTVRKGAPVGVEFAVSVSGPDGPVPSAALMVTWAELKPSGRMGRSTEILRSSADGLAVFELPVPKAAGDGNVLFSLTFAPQLEALRSAEGKHRELIRSFERTVAEKRLEFRFEIISESMAIETAVYITGYLEDRSIDSSASTSAGTRESLTAAGFAIVSIRDVQGLSGLGLSDFLDLIGRQGLTAAERVVFGRVRIVGVSVEDGVYIARAEGSVSVVEIGTGEILHLQNGEAVARGRNHDAAIGAVFRQLGRQLGQGLARELP